MSEERFLYCNESGKWEFYDDTYDITIHCKSKEEQDRVFEMLQDAQNFKDGIPPDKAAVTLKEYCNSFEHGCTGCRFAKGDPDSNALIDICSIGVPGVWKLDTRRKDGTT